MQCITLYICYASEVIEKLAFARSQFLNKIQWGAMLSSLIFSAVIQFQTRQIKVSIVTWKKQAPLSHCAFFMVINHCLSTFFWVKYGGKKSTLNEEKKEEELSTYSTYLVPICYFFIIPNFFPSPAVLGSKVSVVFLRGSGFLHDKSGIFDLIQSFTEKLICKYFFLRTE